MAKKELGMMELVYSGEGSRIQKLLKEALPCRKLRKGHHKSNSAGKRTNPDEGVIMKTCGKMDRDPLQLQLQFGPSVGSFSNYSGQLQLIFKKFIENYVKLIIIDLSRWRTIK